MQNAQVVAAELLPGLPLQLQLFADSLLSPTAVQYSARFSTAAAFLKIQRSACLLADWITTLDNKFTNQNVPKLSPGLAFPLTSPEQTLSGFCMQQSPTLQ